jgi:hypothetical protein
MNRFDLEQAITECFSTCSDLELISENVFETDYDKDSISSALIGLKHLHDMRCQKLFNIFENMLSQGLIKTDLD